MMLEPIPPYHFIDTPTAWQDCLSDLRQHSRLAVDLESNNMFAYRERVCLIQVSTLERDYIVDPLAGLNLAGFGEIIEDAAVEKIFHAAEYDMILMLREFGWELHNLFDTMWAARILGYERIGLANMLNELFEVNLDKRFQRTDWGKRPLSKAQLSYAQKDTHYLFSLRDVLAEKLITTGRMEEACETFTQQTNVKLPNVAFDPDGFWSLNGVRDLTPRGRAILKALYHVRDREAERRDFPLFKVLPDKALVAIATAAPRSLDALRQVEGISPRIPDWWGRKLLRAVEEGLHGPVPKRPKRLPRPSDDVLQRYEALAQWRKERAAARGVESDVIVSRDALWAIARANPKDRGALAAIAEVGELRQQMYGEELISLLQKIS